MKAAMYIQLNFICEFYCESLDPIVLSFSLQSGMEEEGEIRDIENGTLLPFSCGTSQAKVEILKKE